jgi:hypothetical protein
MSSVHISLSISLSLFPVAPTLEHRAFVKRFVSLQFLILKTVGRTPWRGDQPVTRPLPTHRTIQTQNKRVQTSLPWVGFESTIPVFERANLRPRGHCDRLCPQLGKGKVVSVFNYLRNYAMKEYGGLAVKIHVFLSSALVGGEWSDSHIGRFTSGEKSRGTLWIGGRVGPRTGLDAVEKREISPSTGPDFHIHFCITLLYTCRSPV